MADATKDAPTSILLVDDNPTNLQLLMETLGGLGYKLLAAKNGEKALKIAQKANPSLVLLDILMPGLDGYEVCTALKSDPSTEDIAVIFLSALEEVEDKVKGFQVGGVDFITKPFQSEEVLLRVQTQLTIQHLKRDIQAQNEKLKRELRVAQELFSEANQRVEGPLLGQSGSVRLLRERMTQIAKFDNTILMTGPPGAGYEAIARSIHHQSRRAERAFFHINCGTLNTTQSSLFPGSTGLPTEEPNKFQLADGGTIYLDRIQELPLEQQQLLLSYLQKAEKDRANEQAPTPDIRLIVYSSNDLHEAAQDGKFVLGLLPYLNQQRLAVPSLVERQEDIPMLAQFYLRQHAQKLGKLVDSISEASLVALSEYSWPGNLDELKSLIERQVAVTQNSILELDESLFEEGLTLGGYRLFERLGKGGMGEVWKAKHQLLARPAAVKLIRTDNTKDQTRRETLLKRFQREARATSRLQSPHTVTLYDFGVDESGAFYYVMELLDGMDLLDLLKEFGPIPAPRLIHILKGLCRSLEEAHSHGLIHRDIKPANIFLSKLGPDYDVPKLLDFGIVKNEVTEGETELTQMSGVGVLGTPGYIAPEGINQNGSIDHRFDIYSLGCVAFYALTGRGVFESKAPMQLMFAHAMENPQPPSDFSPYELPQALDALILDCLQKAPEQRPNDARELWNRLVQIEATLASPWTPQAAEEWWLEHMPNLLKSSYVSWNEQTEALESE